MGQRQVTPDGQTSTSGGAVLILINRLCRPLADRHIVGNLRQQVVADERRIVRRATRRTGVSVSLTGGLIKSRQANRLCSGMASVLLNSRWLAQWIA